MSRGLLTKSQREFLKGEKDDVDENQYLYNTRSDFRQRMEQLEEDLELLREAGEEELVAEFLNKFSQFERSEVIERIERLEDEVGLNADED